MSATAIVRGRGRSWLEQRKRLYREYERIAEIAAQARTLVDELRRRRDGQPPHTYNLWALREALGEVDHGDDPAVLGHCPHGVNLDHDVCKAGCRV